MASVAFHKFLYKNQEAYTLLQLLDNAVSVFPKVTKKQPGGPPYWLNSGPRIELFAREKVKGWEERLRTVFNRGFWEGYYLGKKSGEWTEQYGSNATKRKVLIGKGTNYFSKIGVAEFKLESNELCTGDDILIIGPTTGVVETTLHEIHVERQPVKKAKKGDIFSITLRT